MTICDLTALLTAPVSVRLRTGARLLLSLPETEQAKALYALIDRNRRYLAPYLPWVPRMQAEQDVQQFIAHCRQQTAQRRSIVYLLHWDESAAGVVSLNQLDWEREYALFGYWLGVEYRGQGLIAASIQALMRRFRDLFSFQTFGIRCAIHNQASQAVAKRAGFTQKARLPRNEQIGETWYDQFLYERNFSEEVTRQTE